jgi:hypothetical protein
MPATGKSGSPIAAETIDTAREARSIKRDVANRPLRYAVDSIQRSGAETLRSIAHALESRGIPTPAGRSTWRPVQVARLLKAIQRKETALRIRLAERGIRL